MVAATSGRGGNAKARPGFPERAIFSRGAQVVVGDLFPAHDELDAAVELLVLLGGVRQHRPLLTVTDGGEAILSTTLRLAR